ncbi:hypothetical protein ABW43_19715, partial [Stenotrophomonas maltophilia]
IARAGQVEGQLRGPLNVPQVGIQCGGGETGSQYPIVSPTDHYPLSPMVSLHQSRMRLARIRNWGSEMVEMESTTRRENSTVTGGR